MGDIAFGFQAAPASDVHKSDQTLYREVMEDCALGQKLGYDAAWLLEHHFSDYYPTPSPLLFMAHIAAAFPDLSLGTSVLVLPWYHPLRLAEEIAMLNGMTTGTLHLGIGRGTAKMEYDAYNVDMNEARARFAECYRIVEKGLAGEPFTHDGRFWKIERPIRLRPEPVAEEGALLRRHRQPGQRRGDGRPRRGADLPLDLPRQAPGQDPRALVGARRRRRARCHPADLGEDVHRRHRRGSAGTRPPLLSALLRPAVRDHYESDANPWADIPEYQDFSRMFANLRKLTDPGELGPFMDSNLVGSPATICRRIDQLAALGFNYFMVSCATPGTPIGLRQRMMTRFAEEVCPRYSQSMRRKQAA